MQKKLRKVRKVPYAPKIEVIAKVAGKQISRNPYIGKDGAPTLLPSVFVFMDILGYSDLVLDAERSGTQQSLLEQLHGALAEGGNG